MLLPLVYSWLPAAGPDCINPLARLAPPRSREGGEQPLQRGAAAVGRQVGSGGRELRHAVAGCVPIVVVEAGRFDTAALLRVGAAGVKMTAGRRMERARHVALQEPAVRRARGEAPESPTAAPGV